MEAAKPANFSRTAVTMLELQHYLSSGGEFPESVKFLDKAEKRKKKKAIRKQATLFQWIGK